MPSLRTFCHYVYIEAANYDYELLFTFIKQKAHNLKKKEAKNTADFSEVKLK